tara:strand:+ start:96 stop:323 length:228 start_codon:yes stop_codon:yes gene_type:complete
MNKSYCIINSTDVSSIDFGQVFETSAETLRYSLDDSQTFVKYEGAKPRFLYGKDTHTHSQILEILAGEDWTEPIE